MATCTKQPIPSKWAAKAVVQRIYRRNVARGGWLPQGYHWCVHCKAFHVTSKRQSGTPWWER